jgi:transcriptional regulator with XRE-family HTH domain
MKNKFPEILRLLLKQHGMTHAQLGKILGLVPTTISAYAVDKARPNIDTLLKIASYFGVSTDYLLTGETVENKIERDELGLPEKALHTLSLLAKTDTGKLALQHISSLICDDKFVKTFTATMERFEDDVCAYDRVKPLNPDDKIDQLLYMEHSELKAARSLYEFFKDFFKRHNIFRPL